MATGRDNSYAHRAGRIGLLYIEPSGPAATAPVIDEAVQKMAVALRRARVGERWRGFHTCSCGAQSDNTDYLLPGDRFVTNSLAVHYLAYHREEVPVDEEADALALPVEPEYPSLIEVARPRRRP